MKYVWLVGLIIFSMPTVLYSMNGGSGDDMQVQDDNSDLVRDVIPRNAEDDEEGFDFDLFLLPLHLGEIKNTPGLCVLALCAQLLRTIFGG